MVLSGDVQYRLRKPGPVSHARFLMKGIYFMKMFFLLDNIPNLKAHEKKEIKDMAFFTAVFYTEWFLRAEIPTVAPSQDMKALWQMIRYSDVKPEQAKSVIDSLKRHTWYIDPTAVVMALADEEVHDRGKIAKKLYSMPENYVVQRQQVDFELLNNLDFCQDNPPSLVSLINEQSWFIFHLLNHGKAELQWLKTPVETWKLNDYYLEFEHFVKNLEVVNDCSERAVKLVQELINKFHKEKKRQNTFLVANKFKSGRKRKKKTDFENVSL
nr:uncharacterized protein LOC124817945 [Hydra vulgaris]